MPIDPKVREALDQRGLELVRAYFIEHIAGRSSAAVPGVPMATRRDAEEWLREEQQRDKRERSARRWLRIAAIAAIVGAVAAMAAAALAYLVWAAR